MVSTSNTKVREGTQPRGLGLSLDPPPLITTDGGVTKWWSDEVEDCLGIGHCYIPCPGIGHCHIPLPPDEMLARDGP